ncbi:hypothetical protein FRX31_017853 [Thalictrum thalictroides]|uniref:Uncharacterized protein n=1 Tax=Thalictrum thalictroides TaxID=46969 RepID=A0A7J6W6L5_THATH|nr:hypothetical protein FRX31_017853 [Thalictrum thalictroides]
MTLSIAIAGWTRLLLHGNYFCWLYVGALGFHHQYPHLRSLKQSFSFNETKHRRIHTSWVLATDTDWIGTGNL